MLPPLKGYELTVNGWDESKIVVNAFTGNAAKYEAARAIADYYPSVTYKDMRCRKLAEPADAGVRSNAEYRGVPFVKPGMLCRLGGKLGRIAGGGYGGAYFRFVAPGGYSCVFHPQGDRVEWLNEDGTAFSQQKTPSTEGA